MENYHPYDQKSDEELVQFVFQDKEVYRYLIQRYEQKLFRFLRSITSLMQEEYEDILQNAFLKAYLNLRDFDTSLKFSSWLYRIVHNEMIDHIRRNKHATSTVSLDDQGENALKLLDILSDETNLPREMDHKLLSEKLSTILHTISVEYREILILRYFEDKDYKEISDILKKPMGTVATLLNRAKIQLREKLDKQNPIGRD